MKTIKKNQKEFTLFSDKLYMLIKPETKSDIVTEFRSCLTQIDGFLKQNELNRDLVVKQSIFVKAENNWLYLQIQNMINALLSNFYDTFLPPTSFIAQTPEGDYSCAIELVILKKKLQDVKIERKRIEEISYTVVYYPDTKEVYAGGLTKSFKNYDPLACAQESFTKMETILKAEQLDFSDVVRQWNYIEDILDKKSIGDSIQQNYQIFNDVRSMYYSKAEFCNGYPAATGIGMKAGGIILEFIAISNTQSVKILPIKNPQQINAYSYSDKKLVGLPIDALT